MRIAVSVTTLIAIGLIGALGDARAADRSRITSFTLSPAEALPPHPRTAVETMALPAPEVVPAVVVPPSPPLAREQLLGRWTERDPAYCEQDQYVLEWAPEQVRILLDGRVIDSAAVRYTEDGDALKVERLAADGAVAGNWRLFGVDDDHVKLVAPAAPRDTALTMTAEPGKLLLRCGAAAAPPPGLMLRARRWWAAFVDRLWPAPEPRPAS
jgi:hypothetical protein